MKALLHTVLRRYFRSRLTFCLTAAMPVLGIISGMVAFEVLNTQEMYFHADPLYLLIAAMFLITAGIVLVIGAAGFGATGFRGASGGATGCAMGGSG